jgi:biopolymer transport protein ExbD
MRLARSKPRKKADWQLQLINIVFLLLLFFVANGTVSNIRATRIELPVSTAIEGTAPVGDAAYLDDSGALSFRGADLSPTEIARLWREGDGQNPPRSMATPLQLLADRHLAARQLIGTLQEFRAAGFENIRLVTLRETGDAQ